jgi:uncharacterized cysteine cluster protein YcgN (CxxCxxCC family)
LDVESKQCTVYSRRFEMCKQCHRVTILHALFDPGMPRQCGYVQYYRRNFLQRLREWLGPARRGGSDG